ncbi:MAG: ribosome maturation factor RimM [Burkholderiaceae bacterium]|nr:ribosome maturation factor RimM [Burkholderiaceae bacterium]
MLSGLALVELPADAVEVGRIQDAWGIKGGFKVLPYSASPEALFSARRWFVQPPERGRRTFEGTALLRISQVKAHGDVLLAHAHDVPDRTAAEALKGARIFVPRSSFPSLPEGEYYWIDLIGLAVINRQGVSLGNVRDLISTGPQQVLVVGYEESGKPCERLIPFVSAYVDAVDLSARCITVDWPVDY